MSAKDRAIKRSLESSMTTEERLDYLRHTQPRTKREADSLADKVRLLEGKLFAERFIDAYDLLAESGYWQSDTATLAKARGSAERFLERLSDLESLARKAQSKFVPGILAILQETEIQLVIQTREDAVARGIRSQLEELKAIYPQS